MPTIESAKNDTFKKLLSLTSSKGLKEEGLFLLSGAKLVHEFLRKPTLAVIHEITTPAMTPVITDPSHLVTLTTELFNQIDVLGTHSNILVLEQPTLLSLSAENLTDYQAKGLEVVIPIGDPGNMGALIRSCEAFGVPRVLLTQEAAHPFLPKAVKASAGSVLRVPMVHAPALRDFPRDCIALDMDGQAIDRFEWPENGLLVVGEEGPGLSGAAQTGLFHQRISIPTEGVESLNVVVAASIALALRKISQDKPI